MPYCKEQGELRNQEEISYTDCAVILFVFKAC